MVEGISYSRAHFIISPHQKGYSTHALQFSHFHFHFSTPKQYFRSRRGSLETLRDVPGGDARSCRIDRVLQDHFQPNGSADAGVQYSQDAL